MRHITLSAVLSAALLVPAAVSADSVNWSDEKAASVEANRNSNAGIGNGGERKPNGHWEPTLYGEDGPQDVDPGKSQGKNRACGGGDPQSTDC